MKIHLSQISEEGVEHRLQLPLSGLPRLLDACGAQRGTLEARLSLRNHEGHVRVSGEMRVALSAPCQRCLDPVPLQMVEPVNLRLAPMADFNAGGTEAHLGAGDLELSYYEGEEIDLALLLEDEVLLGLPETVAGEDDQGRCLVCSKRLDDLYRDAPEDPETHPFAPMRQLIKND
ncbi:MAG: DUF177 domain-containing protein [Deltaproteobacteria bacterium]|nr:DUF177 domain-containing protein [Deltaproteobacteria bacterium]